MAPPSHRPRAAGARRSAFALLVLVCFAALLGLGGAARAESPLATPEEVKAAYLYRFIGYVEWPPRAFAAPDSAVVIALVGGGRMLADLQAVARGRFVEGRPVIVRELAPGDPLDGVHMLFVARDAFALRGWLERARERSVLVVTDQPQGLALGGVLNFVLQDNRVRFEASLPAAEESGLKLSARLLAVASRVVTER